MANANGSIDEIIGQEAIKQIDDATAKMGTLLTTFKESVTAVNLMNDALNKAGSGGSGGLKSNTTAINEQEKALKALIKANEDAGKEYIQLQQLTKQQTAANRLDAQSANASKGSYNELQANMSLLIAKYKALSAEMRSGAIGKGLQADIAMANKSLKDLDAGLGNMQRNVGNYGSALSKVWGGIRQLAYILPGLGIAGIFNLAGEAIIWAADKLDIFNSKVSKSQEIFKEAFSGAGYKSAIENVYTLRENIDLANKGLISKDSVLKEYNETLGKTTGHLSTWNQLETLSIDGLPNYIKMVSLKEEAQAALNKAIQKTTELNQVGTEVSFMDKMNSRIEGYMRDFNKMSGFDKKVQQMTFVPIIQRLFGSEAEKDLTEYLDRLKIKTGVSIDEFTLLFRKKQEEAAALAKKNKFNFIPDKKDPTTTTPKEVNRIDDLKKQMDDDIAVAKVAASEAYKTENELRQDILEIYKKYATEKLKAVKNLNKDEEHSSKQLGEQIVKDTQSIVEKQTAEINKQIKNDIDQHNKALKVKIKNNDERVKNEEKACDDIDKRNNQTFDKQKDDAEKLKKQREDNQKALMDSIQSMQNSTFDIINTISDAINEREMQRLDAKDKALAESYKNELRWIEQSGMSEANKAKAISKLDAQNEAQKKQNDRDRITALRKHARLQKAIDVNQAIANTAVAIVGMLKDPGGYPGVVMSIAAAVTGAAQIARIIATPLPQYAKGRKGGKAEHAIVGEIGQEAIVTTDGKVTLTPSTPSLAYIPQGADVIPHNELIKNSAYVALARQGTVTTDKLQMALIAEFEKNTEEIKALHLTMKSKNLTATYNGLGGFESYKQANIR
jgi:hypothetical protein